MAMQQGGPGMIAPTGARYYCADYDLYTVNPNRSDADIRQEIEITFVFDTWVNSDEVKVDVEDGIVTLTGTVDSLISKRSAGDDAWDTVGVLDVENHIRVKQAAEAPQKQTRARKQAEPAR